jgi:hypothetical protein
MAKFGELKLATARLRVRHETVPAWRLASVATIPEAA